VLTFTIELLAALYCCAHAPCLVSAVSRRRAGDPAEGARCAACAAALFERVIYHTGFLGFVGWSLASRRRDAANQALVSVESVCFLSATGSHRRGRLVAQKLGAGKPRGPALRTLSTRYSVVLLTSPGAAVLATRWSCCRLLNEHASSIWGRRGAVLAVAQPFMATASSSASPSAVLHAGRARVTSVRARGSPVVHLRACHRARVGLRGLLGSTCDWVVRSLLFVVVGHFIGSDCGRELLSPVLTPKISGPLACASTMGPSSMLASRAATRSASGSGSLSRTTSHTTGQRCASKRSPPPASGLGLGRQGVVLFGRARARTVARASLPAGSRRAAGRSRPW